MTTNQVIAMLFPVVAAAGAVGTAFLAKWIWVYRPQRREVQPLQASPISTSTSTAVLAIARAEAHVERAHRDLEEARHELERAP